MVDTVKRWQHGVMIWKPFHMCLKIRIGLKKPAFIDLLTYGDGIWMQHFITLSRNSSSYASWDQRNQRDRIQLDCRKYNE